MVGRVRLPTDDKRKSLSKVKEEIALGKTCCIDECDQPLTTYKGPGDKHLCREHQLMQSEYGGLGKLDRPHTFSREWCCEWCGYSPKDDPWFDQQVWDDELHKLRAMRGTLIGDHNAIRKVDGGSDGKSNVQTLCRNCDAKKTMLNKDYQKLQTKFEVK